MLRRTTFKHAAAAAVAAETPIDELVGLCNESSRSATNNMWPKLTFARAMEAQVFQREVDTLLACVRYGADKGMLMPPPPPPAPSAASETPEEVGDEASAEPKKETTTAPKNVEWRALIEAAQFHGIEARSVLCGRDVYRNNDSFGTKQLLGYGTVSTATLPASITYGVVPLSERKRISDGSGVLCVLEALVTSAEKDAAKRQEVDGGEQPALWALFDEVTITATFATLDKLAATLDAEVIGKGAGILMRHVGDGNEDVLHPLIAERLAELVTRCSKEQQASLKKASASGASSPATAAAIQANHAALAIASVQEALRCAIDNVATPASCIVELLKIIVKHHHHTQSDPVKSFALRSIVEEAAGVVGEQEDGRVTGNVAILRCARLADDVAATAFVELYEGIVDAHGRTVDFSLELVRWLAVDPANTMDAVAELKAAVSDVAKDSPGTHFVLNELTEVHRIVIEALCNNYVPPTAASGEDEGADADADDASRYLSVAYQLVLSHKYHGLNVTADVIRPLTAKLSKLGDSRIFNLVDVCTLFCENSIDIEILDHLFSACCVSGDHHRAKTMMGLLRDDVAGLNSKLAPSTVQSLRKLRILPSESPHLFSDPFKPFDYDAAQKTGTRKK